MKYRKRVSPEEKEAKVNEVHEYQKAGLKFYEAIAKAEISHSSYMRWKSKSSRDKTGDNVDKKSLPQVIYKTVKPVKPEEQPPIKANKLIMVVGLTEQIRELLKEAL